MSEAAANTEMIVELRQVKFFCLHGIYHNESNTGGEFEVNLKVRLQPGDKVITSIDETTNYVRLYELVKQRMQVPTALLETLTMEITENIGREFSGIKEIEISIVKVNPPIENFTGKVAVTYRKQF